MSKEAPLAWEGADTRPDATPPPPPPPPRDEVGSAKLEEVVVRGEDTAGELRTEGDAAALLGMLACDALLLRDEREAAAAAAEKDV